MRCLLSSLSGCAGTLTDAELEGIIAFLVEEEPRGGALGASETVAADAVDIDVSALWEERCRLERDLWTTRTTNRQLSAAFDGAWRSAHGHRSVE